MTLRPNLEFHTLNFYCVGLLRNLEHSPELWNDLAPSSQSYWDQDQEHVTPSSTTHPSIILRSDIMQIPVHLLVCGLSPHFLLNVKPVMWYLASIRVWMDGGVSVATDHQNFKKNNPTKEMEGIKGKWRNRLPGMDWQSSIFWFHYNLKLCNFVGIVTNLNLRLPSVEWVTTLLKVKCDTSKERWFSPHKRSLGRGQHTVLEGLWWKFPWLFWQN